MPGRPSSITRSHGKGRLGAVYDVLLVVVMKRAIGLCLTVACASHSPRPYLSPVEEPDLDVKAGDSAEILYRDVLEIFDNALLRGTYTPSLKSF